MPHVDDDRRFAVRDATAREVLQQLGCRESSKYSVDFEGKAFQIINALGTATSGQSVLLGAPLHTLVVDAQIPIEVAH